MVIHSDSFVGASGTQFTLDGQPFRVRGANNYYLGYEADAMVQPVFELAARMKLNTLRTWAFLDCGVPGVKNAVYFQYQHAQTGRPEINPGPTGLERLDRTIQLAEQYGMRLILPLINYWDDFGGVKQYLQWFGVSEKDDFYRHPQVKSAYRTYVEQLLLRVNTRTGRRYRDEPAILAWELANEPRCDSGRDLLIAWAGEMSSYVKALDPNHLVGVGDEGFFHESFAFGNKLYDGCHGVDCERLLALPAIDFGTCHLYPDYAPEESPASFGARWIREHMEAGERAGKPMLIEEYGLKAGDRRDVFGVWLEQVEASGGAGALVWMIAGEGYPDYDGYTIYSAEEVGGVAPA